MCVGVDVGGLNLEDVCWHSAVRLDAHILVNDGRRETLAVGLRSADAAAAETRKSCEKLCNAGHTEDLKRKKAKGEKTQRRKITDFSEVLV